MVKKPQTWNVGERKDYVAEDHVIGGKWAGRPDLAFEFDRQERACWRAIMNSPVGRDDNWQDQLGDATEIYFRK